MVETRRITVRQSDVATDADEPLLELARRKVLREGGSLKLALRDLRAERRERARRIALADAPEARLEGERYLRVSNDPRWPFGIENERVIAPFGLSECGLPRTVDPTKQRNGPKANEKQAKREARDIIIGKLDRMGCDPIEIMAEIALNRDGVKPEVRLRAASELATMMYPRLRGVEATQRQDKTVFVIGVPTERPTDAAAWLTTAEGPRRIAAAVTEQTVIDAEAVEVKP